MKRSTATKATRLTKTTKKAARKKVTASKKRTTVTSSKPENISVIRYIKNHERAYSKLAEIDKNSLKSAKVIVERLLAKR
jgi:hypothetical protein